MKLCVALDRESKEGNLELVRELKEFDIWLKIGLRSFIRDGGDFLDEIRQINSNFKLFLDLKIYDIPNTMADAAEAMANLHVDMFNVHASAGKVAMKMVMNRLKRHQNPPIVLAVTALTSFDEEGFRDIYSEDISKKATTFAKDSFESGLNGVVCSVYESSDIKSATCNDFLTLTPGIRPFGESSNDQKRVANIKTAQKNRSDFIVVGRPIYEATNPKVVVKNIIENIYK